MWLHHVCLTEDRSCPIMACPGLQGELQEALNLALRVRDSLAGIDSAARCSHDLWAAAMIALKSRNRSLDAENVDRLFSRDNRQVSAQLCSLLWSSFSWPTGDI